jgi:biotin transport system substrate-specific component
MSLFAPTAAIAHVDQRPAKSLWRTRLLPVIFGCALLILFTKIIIPLKPVPISLQTVAVMLIGLLYTRANAIQTVTAYLGLGALGLPVFTGAGPATLIGPTGGYLLGFLAAVAAMTFIRDRWLSNRSSWLHQLTLCVIGTTIVYAFGVSWLSFLVGFEKAIAFGVMPFILPSIVKVAILTSLLKIGRIITTRGSS